MSGPPTGPAAEPDLKRRAFGALVWSLVQNWGGRALTSIVFLGLAALVSPAEFGVAATAILVAMTIASLADLGLGDALVQRAGLDDRDVDGPFFVALGAATLMAACTTLGAAPVLAAIGRPDLAPFVVAAAWIAPVTVFGGIQEALCRRGLDFRRLALRTLAAGLAGGAAGLGTAFAGHGAAAPIVQFAVQSAASAAILWRRPVWRPRLALRPVSLAALLRFGLPIVGVRLIDLVALRAVDLLVLGRFGVAALGLYTVASRVQTLVLQLVQAAVTGVALSVLARVADDPPRLRRAFVRSTSLAATFGTPAFFAGAALAPELAALAFGPRWAGTAEIMRPLLLAGGIQCVHFVAGSFLLATGRPDLLLRLVLVKAAILLPPLLAWPLPDVTATARLYGLLLALEAPVAFAFAGRVLALPLRDVLRPVGAPIAAALAAFAAAEAARRFLGVPSDLARAGLLSLVFVAAYSAALGLVASAETGRNVAFLRSAGRNRPPGPERDDNSA